MDCRVVLASSQRHARKRVLSSLNDQSNPTKRSRAPLQQVRPIDRWSGTPPTCHCEERRDAAIKPELAPRRYEAGFDGLSRRLRLLAMTREEEVSQQPERS